MFQRHGQAGAGGPKQGKLQRHKDLTKTQPFFLNKNSLLVHWDDPEGWGGEGGGRGVRDGGYMYTRG